MKRSASALIAAASLLIGAGSTAATRPHYGGILRITVQAGLTSLDPANSSQPDSFTRRNLSRLIFDSLVDQDDRGRLQPAIATSWEPEPGNQRWHFYLRPGISFHDGTAVNTDTVAASLRTANPNWKVFATGDSVVVECDSPDPWLPAELTLPRNGIAKRECGRKRSPVKNVISRTRLPDRGSAEWLSANLGNCRSDPSIETEKFMH